MKKPNKHLILHILRNAQFIGDKAFSKSVVTVGSSQDKDVCLEGTDLNYLQAQFILLENKWHLLQSASVQEDLFLNGEKLDQESKEVFSGDDIALGPYRILVILKLSKDSIKPSVQATPPPPPSAPPSVHESKELREPKEVKEPPPKEPRKVEEAKEPKKAEEVKEPPRESKEAKKSPPKEPKKFEEYNLENSSKDIPALKELMKTIPSSKGGVLQMLVFEGNLSRNLPLCSERKILYWTYKKFRSCSRLVENKYFFDLFPIVSVFNNNVRISFPSDANNVELCSSNKYLSLKELSREGRIHPIQGGCALNLLQGDVFYISLSNGLQLLFRYTPQTAQVVLSRSLQMSFGEFAALALAFVVVGCLMLYINIKRPQLEMEEKMRAVQFQRKAKFIYKKVEPIPKPPVVARPLKKKKKKKKWKGFLVRELKISRRKKK